MILRSAAFAAAIAASIQCLTVGFLAPYLPREICRPVVRASRTLTLPAASRLSVNNADGATRVVRGPSDGIYVAADIRAYVAQRDQRDLAQAHIDTLLSQRREGETLTLSTEPVARPDAVDLRVDYVIRVPQGTDIQIEGHNGNVDVGRGVGGVSITGSNTDVYILAPTGPVKVDTTNGRIRLYDAAAETSLVTINGSIYVHMLRGALTARTTNGNIVANLLSGDVTDCKLNAVNGGVTLAMPEKSAATVNASTLRGVVRSDLPMSEASSVQRRSIQGGIGEGGTALSLHSLNGNIWLTRSSS